MRTGWPGWSLDVQGEWALTDDEECLTLELSRCGALQLSSTTKRAGHVLPDELLEFAEEEWGPPFPSRVGEFDGVVYTYTENDHCWRRWVLRAGETLLFATYNGQREVAELEIAASERLLNTLRVERSA